MSESKTVTQLHSIIQESVSSGVGSVWVIGEISSAKVNGNHWYLDIVEKQGPDQKVVGLLSVAIFAPQLRMITHKLKATPGVTIEVGTPVRLHGEISLYQPRGTISLRVDDIDVQWTLGQYVADKDAVLRKLQKEGFLEKQKRHQVTPAPFKIGLVTSMGSAAEADFMDELKRSGIAFDVKISDSQVQGADAPKLLVEALVKLARVPNWVPDVVVLIRGGGSKNDLSTYDSEILARTVALAPWPVLTGIGHEIDRSVCDEVAHTAFKTPTAVAGGIIKKIKDYHDNLEAGVVTAANNALASLTNTNYQLEKVQDRSISVAMALLQKHENALESATLRLLSQSTHILKRNEDQLSLQEGNINLSLSRMFKDQHNFIDQAEMLVKASDPAKVLARGYSITRIDGKAVSSVEEVTIGQTIEIELSDGKIQGEVKK